VSIGTLLAFVIVCAGVWILRRKQPELHRPFKTPMVPLVPILGILISFGLMAGLPIQTWMRLFIWLAIGMAIYFGYGRHHSKVALAAKGPNLEAETRGGSRAIGLGLLGFMIGGTVGFLLRPSAMLVGQLPFGTVITRGASLQGLDMVLVGTAQTSFNVMLAGAIIGAVIGVITAWAMSRKA